MKQKKLDASIILTCFNEARVLPSTIAEINKVMRDTRFSYEIIVVDDGSGESIQNYIKPPVRLIEHEKNQGRGAAVMTGIKKAKGKIVGFIDLDLEIPAFYLPVFVAAVLEEYDMAIASRGFQFRSKDFWRIISSKAYSLLVRWLLKLPLNDTESGLKFFKREKILKILPKIEAKRWFWDTEIMARCYQSGLKIKEIPVVVVKRADKKSTVNLLPDTWYYLKKLIKFSRMFKNESD